MVRIPGFHCHDRVSISGRGTEIPQAARRGKNKIKVVCWWSIIGTKR